MAGLILGYLGVVFLPIIFIVATNLMRPRMGVTEATPPFTVRMLISNQIAYESSYPEHGYAKDLASLGGGSPCAPSAEHACLIDAGIGGPQCTAGTWCTRDSYKYIIVAPDSALPVTEFVIAATPNDARAEAISYCASSDGVPRSKPGLILQPPSARECGTWPHL